MALQTPGQVSVCSNSTRSQIRVRVRGMSEIPDGRRMDSHITDLGGRVVGIIA